MVQRQWCDIEISPISNPDENSDECGTLLKKLNELGFDIKDAIGFSSTICFYGNICLCEGISRREKHEELRKAFPRKKITSRWLTEGTSKWDEEFDDEEEEHNGDQESR